MAGSILHGLFLVFHWPAIGFLLLGTVVGLWLGAVPGLSGVTGIVLVLPFIFNLDPVSAVSMLIAIHAVVSTGDTVTAIMLGVPGTAAAQATILDGFPLAKKGQAGRALGAAFSCSVIGGLIGALAMAISLPIALPLILSFGSPEFFLLGLLGLTMVGTVSGRAVSKGLAAALVGLMVSQVGFPIASSTPRYWFGFTYLLDGFHLVPVVLGLFALPELLELAIRHGSISEVPAEQSVGLMEGIRDTFRHWKLVLRSAAIGVYIGMLPGLGAAIVDWLAYGHAVRSCKDNPQFGDGDIRGVIAPEAATHSIRGGDLIPTIAIGIPGSASMAVLLGALLILGLHPGREMLTTKLDITYSMVWTLVIANVLGAGVMMLWSKQVAKAAFLDGHLIVPGVMMFMFMGAWLNSPDLASWITFIGFGLLGFLMKQAGWPRPAAVLGFVLGPIMEKSLVISAQAFTLASVFHRPLFDILLVVTVLAFVSAVRSARRDSGPAPKPVAPENAGAQALLSLVFAAVLLVLFIAALQPAFGWTLSAKLFPITISSAAIIMLVIVIGRDSIALRRAVHEAGTGMAGAARSLLMSEFRGGMLFLVATATIIAATPLIGQQTTLIGAIIIYLVAWGRYKWYWAALYGAVALLVLYGLYDRVLHVLWVPPMLFK